MRYKVTVEILDSRWALEPQVLDTLQVCMEEDEEVCLDILADLARDEARDLYRRQQGLDLTHPVYTRVSRIQELDTEFPKTPSIPDWVYGQEYEDATLRAHFWYQRSA